MRIDIVYNSKTLQTTFPGSQFQNNLISWDYTVINGIKGIVHPPKDENYVIVYYICMHVCMLIN